MKFTLERSDALAALARVTGVVYRNSSVPILNNVLIETEGGTIKLRATDLDMEAVTSCPATIETAGIVTVNAGKLKEVVSAAAAGSEISFELDASDDPRMIVKSGRSRFKMPVIAPDQFPSFPDQTWAAEFEIAGPELSDLFSSVAGYASTEVTRYYLCGVYLHAFDGKLRAVATNGHCLAVKDSKLPAKAKAMTGVIIPSKTIAEAVKIANETGDAVTVSVAANAVAFQSGANRIVSKVIEGNFPDYMRVVSFTTSNAATVESGHLVDAVRRASIAADGKSRQVILDFQEGRLEVSARGQGEAMDEIECDLTGDQTRFGFNAAYVSQCASSTDGAVEIEFSDDASPTRWRATGDTSFFVVITPMRL